MAAASTADGGGGGGGVRDVAGFSSIQPGRLSERAAKNKTGMKSFYGLALRRQGVNGVRNKMLRDKFKVYIFIASVAI